MTGVRRFKTDLTALFQQKETPLRKIPGSFKMPFELKLCSFVSVPSLFKTEIDAFDSFGIE